MSISSEDNNIKMWDKNKWKCILNFKVGISIGYLNSVCFLNDENITYFIINGFKKNSNDSGPMKIYNLNGQKIREIHNSNEITFFLDTYYDENYSKIYLVTGNRGFCQSYDYNKNKIYRKYSNNDIFWFLEKLKI